MVAKKYKMSLYLSILLIVGNYFPASTQWGSDPSKNTIICNSVGRQREVKIAGTSDGGCYISWLDDNISPTQLYLQRLDSLGGKKWDGNGLLVADIDLSPSYLIRYALKSDRQDNAVLVFPNLIREDTFCLKMQKIDPNGSGFLTVDSINLFAKEEVLDELFITETSDSSFVICWNQNSLIYLQKINLAGEKMFGEFPIFYHHEQDQKYRNSGLIKSDSGRVILVYSTIEGLLSEAKLNIYSQKFDTKGNPLWGENGLTVQNLNNIAFHRNINVISDQDCGVIISWAEDRNYDYMEDIFMQRVSKNGHLLYNENGISVCEEPEKNHFYPKAAVIPSLDEIFIFWTKMDENQIVKGIYGQKISSTGIREWGKTGKEFLPLSDQSLTDLQIINFNNSIYGIYRKVVVSEPTTIPIRDEINSFLIYENGAFIWDNKFSIVSDRFSLKKGPVLTIDKLGSLMICWMDYQRDYPDNSDIYAQKLNINGTLGNILSGIKTNNEFPKEFYILQNYPNPFNLETVIYYQLPIDSYVKLTIYNLMGQRVITLINEQQSAGAYQLKWNGVNKRGFPVSSGQYLYKLVVDDHVLSNKMVLLK